MPRKNWWRTTREDRDELRNSADASTIGWFFAAAVVLGYLAGLWFDNHFHSDPWGVAVGVLIGVATGFVNLVQVSNRIVREEDARSRRRRDGEPPPAASSPNANPPDGEPDSEDRPS